MCADGSQQDEAHGSLSTDFCSHRKTKPKKAGGNSQIAKKAGHKLGDWQPEHILQIAKKSKKLGELQGTLTRETSGAMSPPVQARAIRLGWQALARIKIRLQRCPWGFLKMILGFQKARNRYPEQSSGDIHSTLPESSQSGGTLVEPYLRAAPDYPGAYWG